MSSNTPDAGPPIPGRDSVFVTLLNGLSALPLALIVALTFADVFARYLFASPIRGSVEIIQYAMALVIFAALPLVTRARGHITVSLVDKLFSGRLAQLRQAACDAVSLLALALITWRLWAQGGSDLQTGTQTVVLGLPQAPLSYGLCLLAGLASLAMAALLWQTLRGDAPAAGKGRA
jgi:TRAP-type C4-dicarboxylate transport system permease small subunit